MGATAWRVGDRVQLWLPDKGRRPKDRLVAGTVVDVDPEGLPRGVKVALDEEVNGVMDCYATHAELSPVDA